MHYNQNIQPRAENMAWTLKSKIVCQCTGSYIHLGMYRQVSYVVHQSKTSFFFIIRVTIVSGLRLAGTVPLNKNINTFLIEG